MLAAPLSLIFGWPEERGESISLEPVCKITFEGGESKNLERQANGETLLSGVALAKNWHVKLLLCAPGEMSCMLFFVSFDFLCLFYV